jgi:hypothetical protein
VPLRAAILLYDPTSRSMGIVPSVAAARSER